MVDEEHEQRRPERPPSLESASRNTHDIVFELLRQRLDSGAVLDIPCGSGAFTKRSMDAGYRVTGADLARHASVPEAVFQRADMNQRLPFEDAAFDAVVSIEGIEHIERPFDFLRDCARVLRVGGLLILTTPDISSIRSRWRWFLTGFHNKCKYPLDENHPEPRHHINMISFPQLRYMLHTSGMHIEHVTTNRIKPVNWLYLPWAPVQYVASRLILSRGVENPEHASVTREVIRQMTAIPLLFGEALITVAYRL